VLKYLAGLARAIERNRGKIFTGTHANSIEGGVMARVETDHGVVSAGSVVVATNTPVNDMFAIHTKQAPYRTYAIGARVSDGAVPLALYWDTADPYHYVRLHRDFLIVGGEDHKAGQAEDTEARFDRLAQWARERFPIGEVEYRWSGQVMEPVDGLAYIGRNPGDRPNVYIVTGDSGHGMTHGTIAGLLLSDLILGRENPWATLYEPSRKTFSLSPIVDYLKENVNTAARYADYLTGGDVESAEQIAPGNGALLRRGLKKIAVYRDEGGMLHEFSAVCPHLGCVVQWNAAENSWDCPCHGSRFDAMGRVLNGPALTNLAEVEQPKGAG
jgi:nitrite reductase/ring-hydroxylating ferredoxin subunit